MPPFSFVLAGVFYGHATAHHRRSRQGNGGITRNRSPTYQREEIDGSERRHGSDAAVAPSARGSGEGVLSDEGDEVMVFRDTTTTQLRAAKRPFQIFAIELWGYLRLHEGSLDSERMCRNIEVRCENELCFVVEPLKAEIARLQKLLDSKVDALAKTRAERRDLQKLLDAVRKQGEALQQEASA